METAERKTKVYLSDGSGCEKCNFSGRFGGWLNGKWSSYPQISCVHCEPNKENPDENSYPSPDPDNILSARR